MQTKIRITGQIGGNFTLKSKLNNASEIIDGRFNSFILIYKTKKEAEKDLWSAYKRLRSEGECSTIEYRRKHSIYYDASQAVIETNQ